MNNGLITIRINRCLSASEQNAYKRARQLSETFIDVTKRESHPLWDKMCRAIEYLRNTYPEEMIFRSEKRYWWMVCDGLDSYKPADSLTLSRL